MLLQIAICVIAADFITGLVHWWEDAYGKPSWPIIGKHVIEPNLIHHKDPTAMTRGTFFDRNWQPLTAALIASGVARLVLGYLDWRVTLTFALAGLGNEVHCWQHLPLRQVPKPARLLQEIGILQSRVQHAHHHRHPYAKNYCTLTNFTNAVLERVAFWRWLEAAIAGIGITPNRLSAERRGL